MTLEEALSKIQPLDGKAEEEAEKRWHSIAKPLHSLGKMETLVTQIAGITGSADIDIRKKALVAMCADNGVVEEGVTQTGQEVTAIVAENFLTGDTRNMTKGPAMTREEAVRGVEAGIEMARRLKEKGYGILATGEMGIGNTTTSSAVASVLLDRSAEEMTGRGAGLSSEGLERKIQAIKKAVKLNCPDRKDPLDVLAKVGGLDIAGMAGVFLGGAALRIPVVMDGFISCTAALVAQRICPEAGNYMIASHVSREPAAELILNALGKEAVIHGDMCLGEGSGAVALFPFLDMGAAVYAEMSTFEDIKVDQYEELV